MKKNILKALSVAMTLCLMLTLAPMDASAAKIKLNKKKATIKVGATLKLKVKGTKKKATWKSSNKKVATVKAGKVTGKKAGTVTITAKVAKKTLKCVVTVAGKKADNNTPNTPDTPNNSNNSNNPPVPTADNSLKANLAIEVISDPSASRASGIITNNNAFPIDLELKMEFLSGGKVVNTVEYEEKIKGLEASAVAYVQCYNLKDGNYGPKFDSCRIVITKAAKSTYDASQLHAKEIDVSKIEGGLSIKVTAVNNSAKDIKEALIVLVGYDAEGKLIGMNWNKAEEFNLKAGESTVLDMYYVKDANRKEAASHKAYVVYAHE